MRPLVHPCDGVAAAAETARRILADVHGVDPDAAHPCVVMATPPLDAMPDHRIISITIMVSDGGMRE